MSSGCLNKADRLEALVRLDEECHRLIGLESAARLRSGRVCLELRKPYLEGTAIEQLGFPSFGAFCRDRMGIAERTATRSVELYQACEKFPLLKAAFLARELEQEKVLLLSRHLQRHPEQEEVLVELAGRLTLRALREELKQSVESSNLIGRTYSLEPPRYGKVMEAVELCRLVAGRPLDQSEAWELIVADLASGLRTVEFDPDFELTPRRRRKWLEAELEEVYRQWDFLGLHRNPIELLEEKLPIRPLGLQQEALRLQETMRNCQLVLGELLSRLERIGVPCFRNLAHYAEERLGMAGSTARAMVRRQKWFERSPELLDAVCSGKLGLSQLDLRLPLFERGLPGQPWIDFAATLTCKALERWTEHLKKLDQACFETWFDRVPGSDDPRREPPAWLRRKADLECEELALLPFAPMLLALAAGCQMLSSAPRRTPRISFRVTLDPAAMLNVLRMERTVELFAGEELEREICAEAIARAFLIANGDQHGFTGKLLRILKRDRFTCCAPGCTRHCNLQAHHIVFRSHGGGHEEENLIMLCAACHLRLVHRGYLKISGLASQPRFERVGEVLRGEMLETTRGP